MTNYNHPITPPDELVEQIRSDALDRSGNALDYAQKLIHAAYRAGADQELEACCEWVAHELRYKGQSLQWADDLRAARRPKPLRAEEALADFDGLMDELDGDGNYSICAERIRRALERLQELEGQGDG